MLSQSFLTDHDQFIAPNHKELKFTGRIDFNDPLAPCFIYAGSSLRFRFHGCALKVILKNHHSYYDNYIGFVIDGSLQGKVKLENHSEPVPYLIADHLDNKEHEITIFKRQDASHYFSILGLLLPKDAMMLSTPATPLRRMECFGDSVSAGELSEAVEYVGKPDPIHNGEYSNSWYSYASITARRLGASLHNNSQGGIALFDGTGYFHGPEYVGLVTTYDKLCYNSMIGPYRSWDFSLYTPHVVILAIGQNDSHPDNYMGHDEVKSLNWKLNYKALVSQLRLHYPNALIILQTTILEHSVEWDNAIDSVTRELNDAKIVHFLYSNNGCGTPGHIRIPEAEQMADELTLFIRQFGDEIWE